jgi:hypothetical protein
MAAVSPRGGPDPTPRRPAPAVAPRWHQGTWRAAGVAARSPPTPGLPCRAPCKDNKQLDRGRHRSPRKKPQPSPARQRGRAERSAAGRWQQPACRHGGLLQGVGLWVSERAWRAPRSDPPRQTWARASSLQVPSPNPARSGSRANATPRRSRPPPLPQVHPQGVGPRRGGRPHGGLGHVRAGARGQRLPHRRNHSAGRRQRHYSGGPRCAAGGGGGGGGAATYRCLCTRAALRCAAGRRSDCTPLCTCGCITPHLPCHALRCMRRRRV